MDYLYSFSHWVKEHRYLGIWQKLLITLKQETNEVGNLVKSLGNLTGEKQLLSILHHLAWLDGHLDERERKYIQTFSDNLEIDTIDFLEQKPPQEGIEKFNNLRLLVQDYLAIHPPIEQVKLLSDVAHAWIAVDEEITPEEEAIAGEIAGIVDEYVNGKTATVYSLVIHPKTQEQEKAILSAIPDATEECILVIALLSLVLSTLDALQKLSAKLIESSDGSPLYTKIFQVSINLAGIF